MANSVFDPLGELAHAALNISDLGMIILDTNGRIVLWNAWMIEASHIPRDTACGLTITDLFPELVGTRVCQAVQDALQHGRSALLSQTLHKSPFPLYRTSTAHQEGERMQQIVAIKPFVPDSLPRHCLVQLMDVTPVVEREQLLREQARSMEALVTNYQVSERRIHAILDNALDGILTIDQAGMIETYNPVRPVSVASRSRYRLSTE